MFTKVNKIQNEKDMGIKVEHVGTKLEYPLCLFLVKNILVGKWVTGGDKKGCGS